ncbi:MAG TPA: CPBP family intramembrane glutamic endopeptidase [Mucilaginibacter sp.]|jgi:hypothetical protein|nr:CPBP family intramembrane glutamic endopeptidase [Mucilaginibacter sp.]
MTEGLPNPLPRKPIHPGLQLLILGSMLFVCMIFGTLIGTGIIAAKYGTAIVDHILSANFNDAHAATALWILQFASTTFPILITPIFFSYLIVQQPDEYLKHHFHFPVVLILVVIATMLLAMPLIEFLGNFNAKMTLPNSLSGLEDWMKKSEKEADELTVFLMRMPNLSSMIFNLLFIGLLTAIVEEILFRGCMQTIFIHWTKNAHVAVWATAILFSAFHMEFYGFLPRVLLGVLFGYFVVWSGSVWPAIIGHFINNGFDVIWQYLYQAKIVHIDPNVPQMFNNTGYWISFAATLICLTIFWYISKKWHSMHYGEELG